MRRNIEHKEQAALIQWADLQNLPNSNIKIGSYLVAIPNGGARNLITGAILKSEGVRAGFPDLFLCIANKTYHGLFIELKAPVKTARVSAVQKDWISKLNEQGYKAVVCYGFAEAQRIINQYLRE